jgi:transposase, IS30 family
VGAVQKSRRGVMSVEKQEWFIRLIRQGVSNAEACRIVGINREKGTRWRYGRTIRNTAGEAVHYPPVRLTAPTAPHPRYLSLTERTTIASMSRVAWNLGDDPG